MQNFKGTKTEANLKAAFMGESKANASYVCFAAKAKEEGHDAVARYFQATGLNEREHAKIWQRFLGIEDPAVINPDQIKVGSTKDNLQAAINGETYETTEMYPSFAKTAKEEGFNVVARLFDQVAGIEKSHADYFKGLLDRLGSSGAASAAAAQNKWKCDKCGFLSSEKDAPASCPVCNSTGFSHF